MRPFKTTIPFADARRLVIEAAVPIEGVERVAIDRADGRVAARDVIAHADVPPFVRAAMDGYAVIAEDTAGARPDAPRRLTCIERVFTGASPGRALGRGECAQIATGAPLPPGADAVVMVEETEQDSAADGVIRVLAAVSAGQHVGRRGADLAAGQEVVASGQLLTPSRIGALAAAGAADVDVYRRPSVAVLSTGNELVEPGQPLGPGQIYEINRFALAAVIRRHGGDPVLMPTVPDTIEALTSAFEALRERAPTSEPAGAERGAGVPASDGDWGSGGTKSPGPRFDIIVCSGGSSVGERDLVLDALRALGEVVFHGVAVKPGKPTALGRIGRTLVLGLPGNPASCLSNAYMLLVPLLRKTARLPAWQPKTIQAPLARRLASAAGRHQFHTVRLVNGLAEPAFKGSGDITSMANADGFVEINADVTEVPAGAMVTVILFE